MRYGDFWAAVAQLIACVVDDGDAPRICVSGATGTGKTVLLRWLVYLLTRRMVDGRRLVGLGLVVDDKKTRTQFEYGHQRRNVDDVRSRPASGEPPIYVLRGNPQQLERVDGDAVATYATDLARREPRQPGDPLPVSSVIVLDELGSVTEGGKWKQRRDPETRRLVPSPFELVFERGRSIIPEDLPHVGRAHGVAVVYSALDPSDMPRDARLQTDTVLVLPQSRVALEALGALFGLSPSLVAAAPAFPRGTWALVQRGREWDGTVYRCPGESPTK